MLMGACVLAVKLGVTWRQNVVWMEELLLSSYYHHSYIPPGPSSAQDATSLTHPRSFHIGDIVEHFSLSSSTKELKLSDKGPEVQDKDWVTCRDRFQSRHHEMIHGWQALDAPCLMSVTFVPDEGHYLIFNSIHSNWTKFQLWIDQSTVPWMCQYENIGTDKNESTSAAAKVIARKSYQREDHEVNAKGWNNQGEWQMILLCPGITTNGSAVSAQKLKGIQPVIDRAILEEHQIMTLPVYDTTPFLECDDMLTPEAVLPSPESTSIAACTSIQGHESRKITHEWIEYHRLLGVQHFLIYINDPFDTAIADLPQLPYVTYIPFDYHAKEFTNHSHIDYKVTWFCYFQKPQMNDCLYTSKKLGFDWVAMTDVDEYISIPGGKPNEEPSAMSSFLLETLPLQYPGKDYASVQLPSAGYGRKKDEESPPFEMNLDYVHRYFKNASKNKMAPNLRQKHILKPKEVFEIYVHRILESTMPVLEIHEGARLNHYKNPSKGWPFNEARWSILGEDTELRDSFRDAVAMGIKNTTKIKRSTLYNRTASLATKTSGAQMIGEPTDVEGAHIDTPYAFQGKPTENCEVNHNLTEMLLNDIDLGWDEGAPPDWMSELCPEVVDHFNLFPMFNRTAKFLGRDLPIQTTKYAAQSVCTAKIVKLLAASINARPYLYAGSHLGALLHGQPMPWDDDADMSIDYRKKQQFMDACAKFGNHTPLLTHPIQVELYCVEAPQALKVWLQYEGMTKETGPRYKHWSPFVDLFLVKIDSQRIQEVLPNGKENKRVSFSTTDFFPSRPFYYGGVYFLGPQPTIALDRYQSNICVMSSWNHRMEHGSTMSDYINKCLDCRRLYEKFPFASATHMKVKAADRQLRLYPEAAGRPVTPLIPTTVQQRDEWFQIDDSSQGANLTNHIQDLNMIEIDNSISPLDECSGRTLHVVEFNAERGRRWLESVELLKGADIILLNEMDLGMARSDQQHTTKLMAHYLGMNYAFGVEFVELTLGDKNDRDHLNPDEKNFYGLHGNAILSKCKLSDGKIFRNQVGQYFDSKRNGVNGGGLEKRLGGRMVMLCRTVVNGSAIVVGSIHKLKGFRNEIRDYIQDSPTIIAGDQDPSFGKTLGLDVIVSPNEKHPTWPASCTKFGRVRGDNIYSNMMVERDEYVVRPCLSQFGINVTLGDHSLTGVTLQLPR